MKVQNAWHLILLLILISCSKSEDANPTASIELISSTDHKVTCKDINNCPEAAAKVVISYQAKDGDVKENVCSGFIIESDVLVTNEHCLSEELRQNFLSGNKNCSEKIKVLFPKTSELDQLKVGCQEIISSSQTHQMTGEHNTDYVLLRLDQKTNRKPFQFKKAILQDDQNLKVVKMEALTFDHGQIEVIECHVLLESYFFPYYRSGKSKMLVLENCLNKKGNSGSAVVDANGNVLGIANQSFHLGTDLLSKFKITESIPMLIAGSFYCIKNLYSGELENEPQCQDSWFLLGNKLAFSLEALMSSYWLSSKEEQQFLMKRFENKDHGFFRWGMKTFAINDQAVFTELVDVLTLPVPECINDESFFETLINETDEIFIDDFVNSSGCNMVNIFDDFGKLISFSSKCQKYVIELFLEQSHRKTNAVDIKVVFLDAKDGLFQAQRTITQKNIRLCSINQ